MISIILLKLGIIFLEIFKIVFSKKRQIFRPFFLETIFFPLYLPLTWKQWRQVHRRRGIWVEAGAAASNELEPRRCRKGNLLRRHTKRWRLCMRPIRDIYTDIRPVSSWRDPNRSGGRLVWEQEMRILLLETFLRLEAERRRVEGSHFKLFARFLFFINEKNSRKF